MVLPPDPPAPHEQAQALARVLSGVAFAASVRHRRLLQHLMERHWAGDAGALKESVLAVQVFGLRADGVDARHESIVRVEARRLRERLARHYAGEGQGDPLRIELPLGGYRPRCVPAASVLPPGAEAASRHARDLVERGEHFLRQPLSRDSLQQALERFEQACAESPALAAAQVGRGRALLNLALSHEWPPGPTAAEAGLALRQALALAPDQPVAHALLGALEHQFKGRWASARRHFDRAVALAPQQAFVHSVRGIQLLHRGAFDEAEQCLQRARALDPHYLQTRMHMVNLRIAQGRLRAAGQELEAVRDLAPGSMPAAALAAVLALGEGRPDRAVAHLQQACALAPGQAGPRVALAGALGAAGRLDESDAVLAQALQGEDAHRLSPYVLAVCHARCGRTAAAFEALDRALASRDPSFVMLPLDPSFRPLHAHPRWAGLARRARHPRPALAPTGTPRAAHPA